TPPKKAQKFKKPASPKLSTVLASPEEPTKKSKRVKRPAKKSSDAPTVGIVIRETLVTSLSKKKEKMTVEKRKGIDLLSEVALTEEAQFEEVRKKSLRDFHKTHPSGSCTVTKLAPSAAKIKPSVTNKGTDAKPGVPDVTKEESTESESESWGKDEDDSNNDRKSRSEGSDQERDSGDDNTQSDSVKGLDFEHETNENETGSESDQQEVNEEEVEDDEDETNVEDKAKSDDDKGMDLMCRCLSNSAMIVLSRRGISFLDLGGIKAMGLEVGSIRRIQGIRYGILEFLGVVQARIRRKFLDGYGVLVFRIVIFKISAFKL
ncbi:hypothetical protein Tco_0868655, partial [Tanacetum coccineum]